MNRAYYFGNMYLSSIQQGIQALHCTSEMYLKYSSAGESLTKRNCLHEWGKYDKTVVLLNGGDCAGLQQIVNAMDTDDNPYVWAQWSEGEPDLNNALTCVGIVLPDRIYNSAKELRRPPRYRDTSLVAKDLTPWELVFINLLNECRLAS